MAKFDSLLLKIVTFSSQERQDQESRTGEMSTDSKKKTFPSTDSSSKPLADLRKAQEKEKSLEKELVTKKIREIESCMEHVKKASEEFNGLVKEIKDSITELKENTSDPVEQKSPPPKLIN